MPPPNQPKFNWRRALGTFVLAYIAITIAGTALSLAIAAILHTPNTAEPLQNVAYLLSERVLPMLNLLIWMSFSWMYFKERRDKRDLLREALALGGFWLLIALPVDWLGFVVIKSPLSLSPHDFYIGQFPWIYLIYVAVLFSALCYAVLAKAQSKPPAA